MSHQAGGSGLNVQRLAQIGAALADSWYVLYFSMLLRFVFVQASLQQT